MDKNTTVMFPAPLMTTITELGSFLAREAAASTAPAPGTAPGTAVGPGTRHPIAQRTALRTRPDLHEGVGEVPGR